VLLESFSPSEAVQIWAKREDLNPTYSLRDRVALVVLDSLANTEPLPVGATVLEASSGNTGIALARLCHQRGLDCRIVLPANSSLERTDRLLEFGAKVYYSDPAKSSAGAREFAKTIAARHPQWWWPCGSQAS